jgi:hypothetical protein
LKTHNSLSVASGSTITWYSALINIDTSLRLHVAALKLLNDIFYKYYPVFNNYIFSLHDSFQNSILGGIYYRRVFLSRIPYLVLVTRPSEVFFGTLNAES